MRYIVVVLISLFIALQYKLWLGDGGIFDLIKLKEVAATQTAENEMLKDKNRILAAEVDDLRTGLEVVEELARSELGMIREGETFYQVVDANKRKKDASK